LFSFFKSNNPGVVAFYIIYIVLFRICLWFVPIDTGFAFTNHEPLSALLFGWLHTLPVNYTVLGGVLSGILCFVQALIVNGIINENKITAKKNYLGGLIFIILASFFKQSLIFSPVSVALTLITLAISKMFELVRREKPYTQIYDIGFLIALASLFYFPSVLFIIVAYIGLSSLRPFSGREWIATFLGFATPCFLTFTFYYYTDQRPLDFLPHLTLSQLQFNRYDWAQMAALLLCAAASFLLLPGFLYSSLIQVRKFTTILVISFVVSLIAFFMQQQPNLAHWALLSLPVAVVMAMVLFQIKSKVVSEVIHLMLLLLVLTGQYLPLFNLI
jgi:hypothetical protein